MSLLSAPQGTPERVWALLRLLHASGGKLQEEELARWLLPDTANGIPTAVLNTFEAARSLDFVFVTDGIAQSRMSALNVNAFADLVHSRLCAISVEDPDHVLLQVFAWMLVRSEREGGSNWIGSSSISSIADQLNREMWKEHEGELKFNTTKWTPWVQWIALVGLGTPLPKLKFHIYLYERLKRELSSVAQRLGRRKAIPASDFVQALVERMPYLDGGPLYTEAAQCLALARTGHLSHPFSDALRELHDEGTIHIDAPNDAISPTHLAPNRFHRLTFMDTISIME